MCRGIARHHMAKYKIEDGVSIIPKGTVKIEDSAFSGLEWLDNEELTKIVIPNTVKEIGKCSFFDCKNLTSITIPQGVTSIGEYAFYGCKKLTSIIVPDSVLEIGQAAFECCDSLKTITLSGSITKMGISQFFYCYALETIFVPKGKVSYYKKLLIDETGAFLGGNIPQIIPIEE